MPSEPTRCWNARTTGRTAADADPALRADRLDPRLGGQHRAPAVAFLRPVGDHHARGPARATIRANSSGEPSWG